MESNCYSWIQGG